MKSFFKDYGKLWKDTGRFYKNHWLGTIIMNMVVFFVSVFLFWPKELKRAFIDGAKDKFKKGNKEEVESE